MLLPRGRFGKLPVALVPALRPGPGVEATIQWVRVLVAFWGSRSVRAAVLWMILPRMSSDSVDWFGSRGLVNGSGFLLPTDIA